MEESRVVAASMARQAKKSMDLAISLMGGYDEETAEKIMELENQVDRYEDMLGTYLVKLSSRDLSGRTAGCCPCFCTASEILSGSATTR